MTIRLLATINGHPGMADGEAERLVRQTWPTGINDAGERVWEEVCAPEMVECEHGRKMERYHDARYPLP